jgi:plasmid stabilization system protein ParE
VRVSFVEEAQLEFLDAVAYYGRARAELGRRFKQEVDQSIDRAVAHPDLYPPRRGGYRRVNLHIFPYYISYLVRGDVLWILSVSHGSRKPDYWIERRIKAL